MNTIMGFFLHMVGGFCAGSFYSPLKKISNWAWESSWLVMGFFAWLLVPMIVVVITVSNPFDIIEATSSRTLFLTYLFGVIWGSGGPIFNLAMRYLGISLGMTVSLGSGAFFGTLVPPLVDGSLTTILNTVEGKITLLGILLCLMGIAFAAKAGYLRDKQLQLKEHKRNQLLIGVAITFLSGPLGACFAYGLQAGRPMSDLALELGVNPLWQNNVVLVVLLLGGLTSNLVLCLAANIKNRSGKDYFNSGPTQIRNYILASMGGLTWYLQFMFYGMGLSFLDERFHFASWTIHMSFIILFSNLWGLYFKEWKGVKRNTWSWLISGLAILLFSTVLISLGGSMD